MMTLSDIAALDDDDSYERGVSDGRREALQEVQDALRAGDWQEIEALLKPLPSRHCFEVADLQSELNNKRLDELRRQTRKMTERTPV